MLRERKGFDMRSRRLINLLAPWMLVLALGWSAGCSNDRHVFKSTVLRPTSVALVDMTNDQVLWSMDIPTGHKLDIDFNPLSASEVASVRPTVPAEHMRWRLRRISSPVSFLDPEVDQGELDLPGNPVMLKVSYRNHRPEQAPSPNPITPEEPSSPASADQPAATQPSAP